MSMTATPPARTAADVRRTKQASTLRHRRAAMETEKAAVEAGTAAFIAEAHQHMTYPEMAEALGISRPRVAQLVAKAKGEKAPPRKAAR